MRFEDCLNDILDREGLSQAESARKCKIDKSQLNKYVNGKIEPGFSRAADILLALGYKVTIEKR